MRRVFVGWVDNMWMRRRRGSVWCFDQSGKREAWRVDRTASCVHASVSVRFEDEEWMPG